MPDWSQVADHYSGVHLSMTGYLSSACMEIPVDKYTSSVIAGWNPDPTYWFSDAISGGADVVVWKMHDDGGPQYGWVKVP